MQWNDSKVVMCRSLNHGNLWFWKSHDAQNGIQHEQVTMLRWPLILKSNDAQKIFIQMCRSSCHGDLRFWGQMMLNDIQHSCEGHWAMVTSSSEVKWCSNNIQHNAYRSWSSILRNIFQFPFQNCKMDVDSIHTGTSKSQFILIYYEAWVDKKLE